MSRYDLVAHGETERPSRHVLRHFRRHWPQALAPYLFIAPFLVLFAVFGLFAILASFGLSFTNWSGIMGGSFVGLDNYARLLKDASFQRAFLHTVALWFLTVPLLSFGGLAMAWFLESRLVRFKQIFRLAFFLPVLPSLVVVGILFLLLLDPQYGLPNLALRSLGIPSLNIKANEAAAVPILALVVIWRWFGYNMTIHLAGLQALSRETLQAARLDGANSWHVFWRVVVPMSKPILLFTSVLSTIGIFNLFDEPYVLYGTQGGPGEAGLTLGTYLYRQAFENFNLGYASAIAYTIAIVVFIVSFIQIRVVRDED